MISKHLEKPMSSERLKRLRNRLSLPNRSMRQIWLGKGLYQGNRKIRERWKSDRRERQILVRELRKKELQDRRDSKKREQPESRETNRREDLSQKMKCRTRSRPMLMTCQSSRIKMSGFQTKKMRNRIRMCRLHLIIRDQLESFAMTILMRICK